jgi:hypothetical protein
LEIRNNKTMKKVIDLLLNVAVVAVGIYGLLFVCFSPSIGIFPESHFRLSPDSRLPKWFEIPHGFARKDLTVEFYYYLSPPIWKNNFRAILLGPPPNYTKLEQKTGQNRLHPAMVKKQNMYGGFNPNDYPMMTIDTIDDISEIIEQRKVGDILYISDDPELIKAINRP